MSAKPGLVLTRAPGQSITMLVRGIEIVVTIQPRVGRTGQRVNIVAPPEVDIYRTEKGKPKSQESAP